MKKVIIDADTGSDDAVALLMAYRNLAKENILGVTPVSYTHLTLPTIAGV